MIFALLNPAVNSHFLCINLSATLNTVAILFIGILSVGFWNCLPYPSLHWLAGWNFHVSKYQNAPEFHSQASPLSSHCVRDPTQDPGSDIICLPRTLPSNSSLSSTDCVLSMVMIKMLWRNVPEMEILPVHLSQKTFPKSVPHLNNWQLQPSSFGHGIGVILDAWLSLTCHVWPISKSGHLSLQI